MEKIENLKRRLKTAGAGTFFGPAYPLRARLYFGGGGLLEIPPMVFLTSVLVPPLYGAAVTPLLATRWAAAGTL